MKKWGERNPIVVNKKNERWAERLRSLLMVFNSQRRREATIRKILATRLRMSCGGHCGGLHLQWETLGWFASFKDSRSVVVMMNRESLKSIFLLAKKQLEVTELLIELVHQFLRNLWCCFIRVCVYVTRSLYYILFTVASFRTTMG